MPPRRSQGGVRRMERLFSRAEAEALLPTLRPLLEELQLLRQHAARLEQEMRELHWKARGNGHDHLDEELTTLQRRRESVLNELGERVDRIHALGVLVKDLDLGLIDFPHWRGQRVVYLCWKLGEDSIDWWHEVDAGYAGRQRLDA